MHPTTSYNNDKTPRKFIFSTKIIAIIFLVISFFFLLFILLFVGNSPFNNNSSTSTSSSSTTNNDKKQQQQQEEEHEDFIQQQQQRQKEQERQQKRVLEELQTKILDQQEEITKLRKKLLKSDETIRHDDFVAQNEKEKLKDQISLLERELLIAKRHQMLNSNNNKGNFHPTYQIPQLTTPTPSPITTTSTTIISKQEKIIVHEQTRRKDLQEQQKQKHHQRDRLFDGISDRKLKNHKRQNEIRSAFLEAWTAYKKFAFPRDELKPNSASYSNFGGKRNTLGLGLTIFDSLTTLSIMGFHQELKEAIQYIESDAMKIAFNQDAGVSVFEITIRVIGSLLSTYELTNLEHPSLLMAAKFVADKLLFAFNTTTGIPHQTVNLQKHFHWNPQWLSNTAVLSEFGSIQLEFRTLSYHLQDPLYDEIATHLMSIIRSRCKDSQFLCSTFASVEDGQFREDRISLGALGDSYFEYLLKQFMLTGNTEEVYGAMTEEALDAVISRLIRYADIEVETYADDNNNDNNEKNNDDDKNDDDVKLNENTQQKIIMKKQLAYLVSLEQGGTSVSYEMDHLTCFAGGLFALASVELFSNNKSSSASSSSEQSYQQHHHNLFETTLKQHDSDVIFEEEFLDSEQQQQNMKNSNNNIHKKHKQEKYLQIAESLTETCYQIYSSTTTGLGVETVSFANFVLKRKGKNSQQQQHFFDIIDPSYKLRPELLESLFVLYRVTKKPKYQEMAWDIFTSLYKYCRDEKTGGFCGLKNSNTPNEKSNNNNNQDDLQQSYFLAETMKYLFLIFFDEEEKNNSQHDKKLELLRQQQFGYINIDLKDFVFNTEAHPFKRRKRDPYEIWVKSEDENQQGKEKNEEGAKKRNPPRFVPPFVQDLKNQNRIVPIYETSGQRERKKFVPRIKPKDSFAIDDPQLD